MWLLGVSRTLLKTDWNWPVHGLRYPPADGTSGWYIWVGELTADADFFVPLHAGHLIERVSELQTHLSLPSGSRSLIAPDYATCEPWVRSSDRLVLPLKNFRAC